LKTSGRRLMFAAARFFMNEGAVKSKAISCLIVAPVRLKLPCRPQ
jgi:hypothetical protein